MKRIISGKLYDTDKAKSIGVWWNGTPRDFDYVREELLKKRTGEYFLYGEGGPRSRYAMSRGDDGWSGGEKIIPMSYKKAAEWAAENLEAKDFENEFGAISDEGEDVLISVSLPAGTNTKLRRMAAESGISMTALIVKLIDEA